MGSAAGTLGIYRSELARIKKLSAKEEHEAALRFQAGDIKARDALVRACLPLVVSIAIEYRKWGIPLEDIIQQGNIGLLRAVKKFDPHHGTRLSTYAAYWIRAEIREFVVHAYRIVRIGTTKAERKALRLFRKHADLHVEELAEASGLAIERARLLFPLLSGRENSLEALCEDGLPFSSRLRSTGNSPEEECAANEARGQAKTRVSAALRTLDERERTIVRERLMLDEPCTLEKLGARLGVSKERVRQIEVRARKKLLEALPEATTGDSPAHAA